MAKNPNEVLQTATTELSAIADAEKKAAKIIAEAEKKAAKRLAEADRTIADARANAERTIFIPRDQSVTGIDADQVFASVNFKNYLIKTDKTVVVPKAVKEVFDNKRDAVLEARKRAEKAKYNEPS